MNMVKVKTADLIGAQLDWAVAKAIRPGSKPEIAGKSCFRAGYKLPFHPTKNWQHGGPIIDTHHIGFVACYAEKQHPGQQYVGWHFKAAVPGGCWYFGKTHLIAAMRAYVAVFLGDEVEVPA